MPSVQDLAAPHCCRQGRWQHQENPLSHGPAHGGTQTVSGKIASGRTTWIAARWRVP